MIKSVVARTPILVFILMFFSLGYTIAHNKVVVVPLGADAGVSGYEIVTNIRALSNVSAQNTTYFQNADCPEEKKVIGGGIDTGSAFFLASVSRPSTFNEISRWTGAVTLKGGQSNRSTTFVVYAICADTIN